MYRSIRRYCHVHVIKEEIIDRVWENDTATKYDSYSLTFKFFVINNCDTIIGPIKEEFR